LCIGQHKPYLGIHVNKTTHKLTKTLMYYPRRKWRHRLLVHVLVVPVVGGVYEAPRTLRLVACSIRHFRAAQCHTEYVLVETVRILQKRKKIFFSDWKQSMRLRLRAF